MVEFLIWLGLALLISSVLGELLTRLEKRLKTAKHIEQENPHD